MNAIIDMYLGKIKNLFGDNFPYNNSIDKSETNLYVIWLIRWSVQNFTFIIYDKENKKYFTNLNNKSPFWPHICKNLITILAKCKIHTEMQLIHNNFTIETDSPFDICAISFGNILE